MTAQFPDVIIYRNEQFGLCSNPLEAYFAQEKRKSPFVSTSTANWRGYIATWEIENDSLWLIHLQGSVASSDSENRTAPAGLEAVFPGQTGKTEATWFTGDLRVTIGEQLRYVHMGYGSVYESDLMLTIWRGRLVMEELFDNRKNVKVQSTIHEQNIPFLAVEEWSFLRAIRANPNESSHRLVYADWLEERGDSRGEDLRSITVTADSPVNVEKRWKALSQMKEDPDRWVWLRLLGWTPRAYRRN